jgi:hypothetical protein
MLNMYGVYKIFKDGKLVAEEKNKLTLLGRSNALNTMLGLTQSFASTLGIGIDHTPNSTGSFHNKTDLGFSVGKYPVLSSSLSTSEGKDLLVYTSRINDTSKYSIRELGLFSNQLSASSDLNTLTLFNFESGDPIKETVGEEDYYLNDSDSYTPVATFEPNHIYSRIGSYSVRLPASRTIFIDELDLDLSSFYAADSLVLAYYASAAMTVSLKFYNDENSKTYTFTSGVPVTEVNDAFPASGSATYTAANHGFSIGDTVKITGSSIEGFNGTFEVTAVTTNTFRVANSTTGNPTFSSGFVSGEGYFVQSIVKGTTDIDWSNITKIEITTNSGGIAILDGLKISKFKATDSVDGLLSRVVLTTPISKEAGSIIDIEYNLIFDLSDG